MQISTEFAAGLVIVNGRVSTGRAWRWTVHGPSTIQVEHYYPKGWFWVTCGPRVLTRTKTLVAALRAAANLTAKKY